jgi:hypothetical protein
MFKSHGNFAISVDKNIMKVKANGPFNTEAVEGYELGLRNTLQNISGPWGQLNLMYGNCLYTPQAKQKMDELTKLRKDHNLTSVAFVFYQCAAKITLQEQLTEIYMKWDIPCQFFENNEDALIWLQSSIQHSDKKFSLGVC